MSEDGNLTSETKKCVGTAAEVLQNKGEAELIKSFFHAIRHRSIVEIKEHLDCGVDPDVRKKDGNMALHEISESGNVNIAQLLLSYSKQPDVNAKTRYGLTSLYIASSHGQEKFVKFLLENGADPNLKSPNNGSPLHAAVYRENYEIVRLLLEHDAYPNCLDVFCDTPLKISLLLRPNLEIAKLLVIDYHADITIHCKEEMNMFLETCLSCNSEESLKFVILLLNYGADINSVHPRTKKNALHLAALVGFVPLIRLLLLLGVDIEQRDAWNRTPRQVAEAHSNSGAAHILQAFEIRRRSWEKLCSRSRVVVFAKRFEKFLHHTNCKTFELLPIR